MDSERPKELSKVELEQYNVLLEEQAFPFEEKAIELHEVNAAPHRRRRLRQVGAGELRCAARAAPGALRQGRAQRRSGRCDPLSSSPAPLPVAALLAGDRRLRDGDSRPSNRCATRCMPSSASRAGDDDHPPPTPRAAGAASAPAAPASAVVTSAPATSRSARVEERLRRGRADLARRPGATTPSALPRPGASPSRAARTACQPRLDPAPGRQAPRSGGRARAAVKLSPRQPVYWNQLGVTYRQAGQFAKARAAYEKAIALDPGYSRRRCSTSASSTTSTSTTAPRALDLYGRYLLLQPSGDATVTKWVADLKNRKPAPITVSRKEKE